MRRKTITAIYQDYINKKNDEKANQPTPQTDAPIQQENELRLVKWADDRYPPIDLNEQSMEVIALVKAYKQLKSDNEKLKADVRELVKALRKLHTATTFSNAAYCQENIHAKNILSKHQ